MAISKVPGVAGTKTLTRGSIVSGNASGEPAALAIGSNGQVLKSDGTDAVWGTDAGGAALTGSTNNTVVTVTGANAIQGEANLTYDGSTLTVKPASNVNQLKLEQNNATDYWSLHADSSGGPLSFNRYTGGAETERMNISSTGELAVTSSDSASNTQTLKVATTGNANPAYANLVFKSGGNTSGAWIKGVQASGGNDARLEFHTNNSGTVSERMRILYDGTVTISTSGSIPSNEGGIHVNRGNGQNGVIGLFNSESTSYDSTVIKFQCSRDTNNNSFSLLQGRNGGGMVFQVKDSGNVANTNNNYGSLSDIRVKQDIDDASSQWDDIKALKIRKYKLKKLVNRDGADNTPYHLGVVAQELEASGMNGLVEENNPEKEDVALHSDFGTVVDGTADNGALPIYEKDEEGNDTSNITGYEDVFTEGENKKEVKYSVLYMKAIKALQESMERIEQLEAKVTALENA